MLGSSSNMSSSSNSSDSEEFYDAEDITNLDIASRRYRKSRGSSTQTLVEETDATNTHDRDFVFTHPPPASKGKHIFNELRQKLQTDDDDVQVTNLTPPNSQTSSMDGVYAASVSRTTHPFKVIEMDSLSLQSVNSVGRMGRILTSQSDIDTVMEEKQRAKATSMSAISTSSQDSSATTDSSSGKQQVTTARYVSTATLLQQPVVVGEQLLQPQVMSSPVFLPPPEQRLALQEPDVIASAKLSVLKTSGGNTVTQEVPVAPPRRKRKQTTDSASMTPSTSFLSESANNPEQIPPKPPQEKPQITATTSTYQLAPSSATSHATMKGNNNTSTGSSQSLQLLAAASKTGSIKSTHSSSSNRNTLDIRQIMEGGQFVVKPQDVDRSRIDHVSVSSRTTPTRNVINGAGGRWTAATGGARETVNRGSVGQYSLGSQRACHKQQQHNRRKSTERRKSAGDENLLRMTEGERQQHQQSPKCHNPISDYEILEKVTVLNLDTGERVPLSVAEDKLPQCINPLSLHIMRLTSEYISSNAANRHHHHNDKDGRDSDEESIITTNSTETTNSRHSHFLPDGGTSSRSTATLLQGTGPGSIAGMDDITDDLLLEEEDGVGGAVDVGGAGGGAVRRKTARIKKFLGSTVKKTMHKAKSIAQEVSHARHKEDVMDLVDEVNPQNEGNVKLKAANSHKGPYDFENVHHVQELKEHDGPIWCMKFSCCGRLLATAGQDKILRIWILKDAVKNFQDMRRKYNADKVSPTPSQESLASHNSFDAFSKTSSHQDSVPPSTSNEDTSSANASCIFMPQPFCTYSGHTSDIMDVSWSKNYFILSSSMDKTVRLWHISRKECLCCFQHIDFVTAIVFHPRDDRYFLSGSLDGKLRLWNIPDKKVAVWNEIADGSSKLITAANFCQNGKFAVVGAYDGRCIFYHSDQLKYHTQISVRSTRGKNATGRKISGIEPMPGEDKILVTSNDSRIRLYDLRDLNLSCKYKGYVNVSSQIKGSFSHDGKYIICGSENRDIFIWKTSHDYSKFSSVRRDRNDFWEAIKAHNALVTCAIFAPNPDSIISSFEKSAENESEKKSDGTKNEEDPMVQQRTKGCGGYVIISADFNGCIKIFINKTKPKHSSLPASALV